MRLYKDIVPAWSAIRLINTHTLQRRPPRWHISCSNKTELFIPKYPRSLYSSIAAMATKPHKITVYHLNNSRSIRITSLLEELSIPYTIMFMRRNETGQAPKSLGEIHPLRKSPTVVIQHTPDSPEIVLHESAFILRYICEYWGEQFLPKKFLGGQQVPGTETEAWRRNEYFLVQPEGTLMPNIQIALIFHCAQRFLLS
jgi:Glutathione S-transferase, N-terminal domain